MSKLQTRPRQLGQESPASAPRLLSVVRRTVLGEAARTTRALSVPPGPRDGSDLVATRDGEPVFRARVLFLRALADLGLVPLAERCDAALFAPTAREAWSTFGDKLGEGTPPYEAVLRRREHLAAEVNANDAGAATRSLRASTSPEDFRRDPRSLYITVCRRQMSSVEI